MLQAIADIVYLAIGAGAVAGAAVMLRRHGQTLALQTCPIGDTGSIRAGVWIIVTIFVLGSVGFLLLLPGAYPVPPIPDTADGWAELRLPVLRFMSVAGGFVLVVGIFYSIAAAIIVFRAVGQMPAPPLPLSQRHEAPAP
jgi:hypothetical protein